MIQVNLLPWRQEARKIKKARLTILAIVFAGIALFFIIACHLYLHNELSLQLQINQYLQTELTSEEAMLTSVDAQQQKKKSLEQQLNYIIQLYAQNYQTVQLLNELTTLLPSTISLEKVVKKVNHITFEGTAPSAAEVTLFIQQIGKSAILTQPVLSMLSSEKIGNEMKRSFQITMIQKG
ncbi:MAG: PilN domain-containing protein [Gammaproteobacteria bacterium]|nr:PilN domain-containing protein [Gammaproteobacteria bacterium]